MSICGVPFRSLTCGLSHHISAGLRRPRPHIQFYRERKLSIGSRLRYAEPRLASTADDAFVPSMQVPGVHRHVPRPEEPQSENTETDVDNEVESGGIEHTTSDCALPQGNISSSHKATENDVTGGLPVVSSEDADAVHRSTQTSSTPASEGLPLEETDGSDRRSDTARANDVVKPELPAASPKSKTRSRYERKLRRIADNTYKPRRGLPPSGLTKEGNENDDTTQAVLENIMSMDGGREPVHRPGLSVTENVQQEAESSSAQEEQRQTPQKEKPEVSKEESDSKHGPETAKEPWQVQKGALRDKFGEQGWQPRKRLSPDALEGIRALHASDREAYSTPVLAEHFRVTPEAIRRILKSKWRPSEQESDSRRERWERRGLRTRQEMADKGIKPPARWREKGVKMPKARPDSGSRQGAVAGEKHDRYVRWA